MHIWKQKLRSSSEGEMDLSVMMLFFVLSTSSTSSSKTKRNNGTIGEFFGQDLGSGTEKPADLGSRFIHQNNNAMQNYISETAVQHLTGPWMTIFVPSVYILVVAVSLPLNLMAILVFLIKMKIKKPAVVYMLNLSCADVLFVSVLPFKISYHLSGNHWVFGPTMCHFVNATYLGNMYCSMLLLMAISIDRFLAVVYPIEALTWRTVRSASTMCFVIWVFSIAGAIPRLITKQPIRIYQLNITTCYDVVDDTDIMEILRYYHYVLPVVFFFIPLVISTTCYVYIIKHIYLSAAAIAKPSKKRRAVLLSAAVLCAFIACFGPTNVLQFVQNISFLSSETYEHLSIAYKMSGCTGTISCCIDPLIYYYASSDCRRQVRNILCCKNNSELGRNKQSNSNVTSNSNATQNK